MSSSTSDSPRDLAGRFRVESRLGRGGMGDVYRAYDTVLERTVAVKTVTPGNADAQAVERLLREARACARLTHPGIVTVHDVLQAEGSVHIVMEHLPGTSLESLHCFPRFSTLDAKIDIIIRILDALHYAHGRGVVHRDIKPTNVQLLPDGSVKLLDFGIAHLAGASTVTVTGAMTGTAHYASPEQLRGEESDASTDIYSTGILAYELLTRRRPFDGDSLATVLTKVLHDPLPAMEVPFSESFPDIERIIRRATAKRGRDRYGSAEDMKNALTAFLASSREAIVARQAEVAATTHPPDAATAAVPASAETAAVPASAETATAARATAEAAAAPAEADTSAPAASARWPGYGRLAAVPALVVLAGGVLLGLSWMSSLSRDDALSAAAAPSSPEPEPVEPGAATSSLAGSSESGSSVSASSVSASTEETATGGRESAAGGAAAPPPPAAVPAPAPAAPVRAAAPPPSAAPSPPAPSAPVRPSPPLAAPAAPDPVPGAKDLYYAATRPGPGSPAAGATPASIAAAKAGIKYRVLREEPNGDAVEVSADTLFRSGDRIRFAFEPNIDGFLYVIQRGSTGRWSVLLPHPGIDGGRNSVTRFDEVVVPPDGVGWFRFDENPGSQTLFVYLSEAPLVTLPWGVGPVVDAQSLDQPTVIALANSVRSRDLVFEQEDARGGADPAAYVVNQDDAGGPVAWTLELRHR